MKNISQKLKHSAMIMCFALVVSLVFESNAEAQGRGRGVGGGNSRGQQVQGKNRIKNRVKNKVQSKVRGQAGGQVKSKIKGRVKSKVKSRIKDRVRGQIKSQVKGQIKGQIKNQIKNQIKGQIKGQVKNKIKNRVKNGIKHAVHNHNGRTNGYQNKWIQSHKTFHGHVHWNPTWRHNRCLTIRQNRRLCWSYTKWCGYYSRPCHWWYNYCGTNYYFDPTFSPVCELIYYPVYVQGVVATQYQWYLGMDCVFIPGLGYGIQSVQPDSPAALAGLAEGMIVVAANGLQMETETAMTEIMQSSDGLLALNVIADESGQQQLVDIQLTQVPVSN